MYSGPNKKTFMTFDVFKEIVDSKQDDFELQLEGGEPLLNPLLQLFIWYAWSTKRCKKIIITTNGKLLLDNLQSLVSLAGQIKTPIHVKMSINYCLLRDDPGLCKKARDIYLATEFLDFFSVSFNVRLRNEDNNVLEEIRKYKIEKQCSIYKLQRYGRLSNRSEYEKPIIVQNIDDWFLYSCDGKCFGKDLVTRSDHERFIE
jgi:organic radical activating enzyme